MKLLYLGTAAAEGWPAPFCQCDNCKAARIKKGKNIRSRPQVLINDDLLMDYGPDTFCHSLQYDLNLDLVKTVLRLHTVRIPRRCACLAMKNAAGCTRIF